MNSAAPPHTSKNCERNPLAVTSDSVRPAMAMKSLRLSSSISGWSRSKPAGGRFSASPPSRKRCRNRGSSTMACQRAGREAMADRMACSVSRSGRQVPQATKALPGSRCR